MPCPGYGNPDHIKALFLYRLDHILGGLGIAPAGLCAEGVILGTAGGIQGVAQIPADLQLLYQLGAGQIPHFLDLIFFFLLAAACQQTHAHDAGQAQGRQLF